MSKQIEQIKGPMITKCRNDRLASLRTFYIASREGDSKEAAKNNKERPREIFLGKKIAAQANNKGLQGNQTK